MRIALCTRYAWPSIGGIETEVRTLAEALAAEHEVGVFAHRIGGSTDWCGPFDRDAAFAPFRDPESDVVTRQLRLTVGDMVALAPTLAVFALRRRGSRYRRPAEMWHARVAGRRFATQFGVCDLVHRFGGNRMSLASVVAARRRTAPIVITPNAHPGQWDDDELSAIAYRNADLVVATCSADARTYLRLGVEPSRIELCGIASREIAPGGGARVRHEHRIDGPLILFVGVRRAHKGVSALTAAAHLLLATNPSARVAVVGPGEPLAPDTPPNVLDVGEVDQAERDAWFDAADILCLPSLNESWGLAVSEAWSASTPVVTSDIAVLRERVERAGAGLSVATELRTLAGALQSLLDNAQLRRRMGRAGRREWETSLSPASVARRHLELYERARSLSPPHPDPTRVTGRDTVVRGAGG